MAGEKRLVFEEILTEKQIQHILKQTVGENSSYNLKGSVVRPAVDGIAGFLGDHLKAVLHVNVRGEDKKVHLFLKRIPVGNDAKADFINEWNYYRREKMMYRLLDEICEKDLHPWCVKAYVYTDTIFVMPDLALEGYSSRHYLETLDLEHILLTTTALARFHAAFVNYETKKSIALKHPYRMAQEFGHLLTERQFCDSTFMRACPKVSEKLLQNFSTKPYRSLPNLESKLLKLYLEACDSLTEYEYTINVMIHKDLWMNNIMFKYENGIPVNALLVDFQSVRYAPPAFDVMLLLYLTTDRSLRQEREKDICHHYYSTFVKNLSNDSKKRLKDVGYDEDNFLIWCDRSRMFGMMLPIALYPFALMDPKAAQMVFDDPETCQKHFHEDRSEPVVAYAAKCEAYKFRNLQITEEFVETYMLKDL